MKNLRRFNVLALLLAAGLALVAGAVGGADGALTDEDIVRGFVTGKSASELIELIDTSEVDFDVSREMLSELRTAGLPDAVIEAMKRRQAEVDAANRPAEPDVAKEPASTFEVLLNPEHEKAEQKVLRYLDTVPGSVVKNLRLGAEARRFTDISIFLGCTRVQHVPDHWRSKTPLGRDFIRAPRHRLLAWVSGARAVEENRLIKFLDNLGGGPDLADAAILELDIPKRLEATVEPDDTHDLILGVALEAGGRFYMFTADAWDDVSINSASELSAILTADGSPRAPGLKVRFNK